MIYIYKKDKLIDTLNYDINEFKKEWYPNFQKDMKVYDRKFEYPIFENEELREMTKEEKIKNDIDVFLDEGEIIENKNLIKMGIEFKGTKIKKKRRVKTDKNI